MEHFSDIRESGGIEPALAKIIKYKPKVIFLTGKTCLGKSIFSFSLRDNANYCIFELDTVVRMLGSKHNLGTAPDYDEAFSIYKNNAPKHILDEFVANVQHFIRGNKLVVVEGALASPELIRRIFTRSFIFAYLYPWNSQKYLERIQSRVRQDIIENTRTLPFWKTMPEEVSTILLTTGVKEKSTVVVRYLSDIVKSYKKSSNERYKMFGDSGFKIYTIVV